MSVYSDLILGIHNDGAATGYELGARVGDEAGANLTVSHRSIDEMDNGDVLISQFRASLSAPVGDRLRVAGAVLHEDIGQDSSRGLRLQVEGSYRFGDRYTVIAHGGIAGRDAGAVAGTAGLGLGLKF